MTGLRSTLLVLSDSQLGAGASLTADRLADQARMLDWIADLADERDVDAVLHAGDVFEHRSPSNDARLVFKRWVDRVALDYKHRPIYVVRGNHDTSTADGASSLDLYDGCEFVRQPQVLDLGGAWLACLPWTPVSGLVAKLGSADRDDVNALAADALVAEAARLFASTRRPEEGESRGIGRESDILGQTDRAGGPGVKEARIKPAILALHWLLNPTWTVDFVHKPVLDVAALEAQGWDLIVAGDDHARGWRGDKTLSLGSPWICSFGEVDHDHGVWIVDCDRPGDPEFVAVPDRRFLTIEVDLRESGVREEVAA